MIRWKPLPTKTTIPRNLISRYSVCGRFETHWNLDSWKLLKIDNDDCVLLGRFPGIAEAKEAAKIEDVGKIRIIKSGHNYRFKRKQQSMTECISLSGVDHGATPNWFGGNKKRVIIKIPGHMEKLGIWEDPKYFQPEIFLCLWNDNKKEATAKYEFSYQKNQRFQLTRIFANWLAEGVVK